MVTGVCEGSQDPSQGSLVTWKKNIVSCMYVGCRWKIEIEIAMLIALISTFQPQHLLIMKNNY